MVVLVGSEIVFRGLKPGLVFGLDVEAKAWTYLKSYSESNRRFPSGMTKQRGNGKGKSDGKSKYNCRFPSGMTKQRGYSKNRSNGKSESNRRFPSGMTKQKGEGKSNGKTEADPCGMKN